MTDILLDIRNVSKSFDRNKALDCVSLSVSRGEIVGLLGHNGSGKSTLVKILSGHHISDGGEIWLGPEGGTRLHFIHQNLGLVGPMSVIENLCIGITRHDWGLRPLRHRRERSAVAARLETFGVPIDPDASVDSLTPAERTIVAIVRALSGWEGEDNVLVLDEPTAALHGEEVEILKEAVRKVASQGAGVIYITHRLAEVVELTDRAIVLKNGRAIAERKRGAFDHSSLVELIVGHDTFRAAGDRRTGSGPEKLTISDLRGRSLNGVSISAIAGEVLGVYGLVGSGMEQLNGTIFGVWPRQSGQVLVGERAIPSGDPAAAIKGGIAYVPADRRAHGGFSQLSALENVTLPQLRDLRRPWGAIDRKRETGVVRAWMERLQVKPQDDIDRPFDLFSGGNQQKIVLAKWLRTAPEVLLVDEPTQGVDAGTQAEIYHLLTETARQGAAVVVSSSDAKELAAVCDRVFILCDGVVAGMLAGGELTEAALVEAVLREQPDWELSS